jgi:hypothetical protein
MASARTAAELRRWGDLAAIRGALAATMPVLVRKPTGLREIADLCRRRAASCLGRDRHETRDLLLIIACEWDLTCDRLDEQSGACLRALARLLA